MFVHCHPWAESHELICPKDNMCPNDNSCINKDYKVCESPPQNIQECEKDRSDFGNPSYTQETSIQYDMRCN